MTRNTLTLSGVLRLVDAVIMKVVIERSPATSRLPRIRGPLGRWTGSDGSLLALPDLQLLSAQVLLQFLPWLHEGVVGTQDAVVGAKQIQIR